MQIHLEWPVIGVLVAVCTLVWGIILNREKIPAPIIFFFRHILVKYIAWVILLLIALILIVQNWMEDHPAEFPVERAPKFSYFANEGRDIASYGQGKGSFVVTNEVQGRKINPEYSLIYELPDETPSYVAGIIWFDEPIDISSYSAIAMDIRFGDKNGRCQLRITDTLTGDSSVLLGDTTLLVAKTEIQPLRLPFKAYFPLIALRHLRSVALQAKSPFATGKNSCTAGNVRFVN